jgi:hypothetical protein
VNALFVWLFPKRLSMPQNVHWMDKEDASKQHSRCRAEEQDERGNHAMAFALQVLPPSGYFNLHFG